MVSIEHLSLKKKGEYLLENVSLRLKKGRTTVLLGPNGSGKTTLMRVLSSFYRDYEGMVCIDNLDLKKVTKEERQRSHAYLSQSLPGVRFTLSDLLSFSNSPDRAESAASKLGLSYLEDSMLEEMSGGEKALSYLCLLFSQDAKLYLLDEPDASLDPKSRKILEKVLSSLKERDAAVLVSMHDLNRAMRVADDVVVLDKGNVVFCGDREEFLVSSVPEKVFGEKAVSLRTEKGEELKLFL